MQAKTVLCVCSKPTSCQAAHPGKRRHVVFRTEGSACYFTIWYFARRVFWTTLVYVVYFLACVLWAGQTSAQHWTFCTDWITVFIMFYYATHRTRVPWRRCGVCLSLCNRVAADDLKHWRGTHSGRSMRWRNSACARLKLILLQSFFSVTLI